MHQLFIRLISRSLRSLLLPEVTSTRSRSHPRGGAGLDVHVSLSCQVSRMDCHFVGGRPCQGLLHLLIIIFLFIKSMFGRDLDFSWNVSVSGVNFQWWKSNYVMIILMCFRVLVCDHSKRIWLDYMYIFVMNLIITMRSCWYNTSWFA